MVVKHKHQIRGTGRMRRYQQPELEIVGYDERILTGDSGDVDDVKEVDTSGGGPLY